MGDKFVLAFRSNADVGDCKALPELDQARLREKIGRRRLSEKVDGEIDGDRKRHPSNRRKDRDIRRKIRQRHHGRARDRPAGPQRSFAEALTDAAPSKPDHFDAIEPPCGLNICGNSSLSRRSSSATVNFALCSMALLPALRIGYNAPLPIGSPTRISAPGPED